MKKIKYLGLYNLILLLFLSVNVWGQPSSCNDLFFSEYIEGSSNNKAIEIYNPTDSTIDLSAYKVRLYSNGSSSASFTLTLSGTLDSGDVYVIANFGADTAITNKSNISSNVCAFNGNDALELVNDTISIDVLGEIGVDPGTNWAVDTGATSDYTLIRKSAINEGQLIWSNGANEWDVYSMDFTGNLGAHTMVPCSDSCAPTSNTINETACDSYTSPSTNYTWNSSGTYMDTLLNSEGCDSILTIQLTIDTCADTLNCSNLFFSEYIEGSSNNKALEIYNPTSNTVNLSDYSIKLYSNGASSAGTTLNLAGSIDSGETYVVALSSADTLVLNQADTTSGVCSFNGNDAIELLNDTISIDIIGEIGVDPGTNWVVDTGATSEFTLVRKSFIRKGQLIWTNGANEWDVFPLDHFSNLGSHNMIPCSDSCTATNSNLTDTVCDSYTSPSGNYMWTSSGTFMDTILNTKGCDSVLTIQLTVYYSKADTDQITACDSYTWIDGSTYTASNNSATHTLLTADGCDSTIHLDLTINYSDSLTLSDTTCNSYLSPSGNYTWTSSGTYKDTMMNVDSCDSIITVNLTVLDSSSSTISDTACLSYVSPSGNYIWDTSGTFFDTLTNTAGCDSFLTINLTIDSCIDSSSCQDLFFSEYIEGSSNNKALEIFNPTGKTVDLNGYAVKLYSNGSLTASSTLNLSGSLDSGEVYIIANSGADTLITAIADTTSSVTTFNGNDAIELVNDTISIDIIGEIGVDPGTNWAVDTGATSEYTLVRKNYINKGQLDWSDGVNEWDVYPLDYISNLGSHTFIPCIYTCTSTSSTLLDTVCDSYISPSGNYTWTTSGTYMDTITNNEGCDSVITINLIINYASSDTDVITSCDSYMWIDGITYTSSNDTAKHVLTNTNGCDSIVYLDLTINNSTTSSITDSVCNSYTSPSGNYTWDTSGTYIDTLSNMAGCDSILTIDLTVTDNLVSISNNNDTLEANIPDAEYQWLDCEDNFNPISGETNRWFTPLSNGDYAVEVTENNCVDTSDCMEFTKTIIGIQSIYFNEGKVKIYPNPSTGNINITFTEEMKDVVLKIYRIDGVLVEEKNFTYTSGNVSLDLPDESSIYFLEIITGKGEIFTERIIRQ